MRYSGAFPWTLGPSLDGAGLHQARSHTKFTTSEMPSPIVPTSPRDRSPGLCAVNRAPNATIDVIEQEDLPRRSQAMGDRLRAGLEALQRRFPKRIGDVRGMGLMQAIELVKDEAGGDRTA